MRIGAWAAAVLVITTSACGQSSSSLTAGDESPTSEPDAAPDGGPTGPPPLTWQRPEGEVDLAAYSWCYHDNAGVSGCADGAPPGRPPRTSATGPLAFTFPLEGWAFTASFRQRGPRTDCERAIEVDARAHGDGTIVVPRVVPAGRWEVQIIGTADDGGSLSTVLDWTTSGASTATPRARGDVGFLGPPSVYDDDEELQAYGPSLTLTGLAVDPVDVTSELVVSSPGAGATYPLYVSRDDRCPDNGTIVMAGAHPEQPLDLPDLGEPPFTYEVRLTLDGNDHVGTGQWPDDLTPAMSNQLRLAWSPPLPAWDGSP